MILRKVPIEIRDSSSLSIDSDTSMMLRYSKRGRSRLLFGEIEDYEDENWCRMGISCFRSRSRSRSPSQKRCRALSPGDIQDTGDSSLSEDEEEDEINLCEDQHNNDGNPSDVIRQIIGLQNFNGLWSINDLKQISSLLQQSTVTTVLKDVDLEKSLMDYKDKDNDVILSMIIMFIFAKYFTKDESLWKPLMKKCAKTMENRLGNEEYNEISDKIKKLV